MGFARDIKGPGDPIVRIAAVDLLYAGESDPSSPPTLLQADAAHAWSFSVGNKRRYQWHRPSDLYSDAEDVIFAIPAYPVSTDAGKQVRWRVGFRAMNFTGSLGTGYDVEIESEFDVPDTFAEYWEAFVTIGAQYLNGFHIANIVVERVAVVDGTEFGGGIAVGVPHVYYNRTQ